MIVVDAGVIVATVCDHPLHEFALALFEEDSEWIAPLLWQSEVRNVIGHKLCKLAKMITGEEAHEAYRDALALLHHGSRQMEPENCMATMLRYGLSGYVAEYVALAEKEQVSLATTDRRMLKQLQACGFQAVRLIA